MSATRTASFERSTSLDFTFAPHTTTVLELKLTEKGVPYWSRPDLGIGADDVKVEGAKMTVTVHSLGSVDAPASKVVCATSRERRWLPPSARAESAARPHAKDGAGHARGACGADLKGATVTVECGGNLPEITLMNNSVTL